ncbi:MAG: PTS sugar transporter subunit IIA [Pseudomonadota bacterium]|jgi:PTS system nitrogen regulatory IIA component
MELIAKILPAGNVLADLDAGSKKEAFEKIGRLFEDGQHIAAAKVTDSLLAREKLGSTGLGHGVAIPHGRLKALREAVAAFVRLKNPIPFEAPDGKHVSLLFILLVPERATDLHLQILGELAQMFSDRQLRERLLACTDSAELHRLLIEWSPHAPNQRPATL